MGQSAKVRLLAVILAAAAVAALSVTVAGAASVKNGIRPLAPKNGAVVPTTGASDKVPTFKVRVRGRGVVYFHVCKRKKRDAAGRLCGRRPDDIDRGKKGKRSKGGRIYKFTPRAYTFPGYYLNTPGTYYWQAHRIANCTFTRNRLDCAQEGPIKRFRVR